MRNLVQPTGWSRIAGGPHGAMRDMSGLPGMKIICVELLPWQVIHLSKGHIGCFDWNISNKD